MSLKLGAIHLLRIINGDLLTNMLLAYVLLKGWRLVKVG